MSDERTQRLVALDAAHVWSPFTQMQPCRLRLSLSAACTDDAVLARTPALVEQEAR